MGTQPNILLIMTDQHRLSAVGAYGPTPCKTPHIDALAREGVRFQQAYCPTAICSPTRASVLTGVMPHRHGMTANIADFGCNQQHIQDDPKLLSRRLQAAGYACGYSGKWHLCAERNKRTRFQADYILNLPSDLGFEGHDVPGHGGGGYDSEPYLEYLKDRGLTIDIEKSEAGFGHEAGVVRSGEETLVPYCLTENTIDLMKQFKDRDQPWFIWHNFWGPHEPYFATERWLDYYNTVEIPKWPDFSWDAVGITGPHQRWLTLPNPEWEHWAELIRHYYACTSFIDEQIGRMVEHLRNTGELDNTWIIVTADHGESLGSHGGLANKGAQPFEEVLRVPLIIHGPELAKGTVRDELVANLDVFPTICAVAGAPCPAEETQGLDLTPLCKGHAVPWRDCWVSQSHGISGQLFTQRVLRWKDFTYSWTAGHPELLFNLADDPHQMTNLAGQGAYADQLQTCRDRLRQWMVDERDMALQPFDHEASLWAAGYQR